MTWRMIRPLIRENTATYLTGIRITKTLFRPIATVTDHKPVGGKRQSIGLARSLSGRNISS
ncbi:hypothetical protein FRUB_08507 [Fimbriiglobus ruber]|uniref:Uncharacterized protein n=1 Tax=Fimbriiglobus ruber TaxID=1908690 RepID=A0A225D8I2_9BACT|nr:hypothetical protein FRUB_08507 [Fimbriiglobus ruber]